MEEKKKKSGIMKFHPRQPRTMKNRCSCKETQKGSLKCSMFTETDRQNIFKEFWTMSWAEKKFLLIIL